MANSTTNIDQILSGQSQKEVTANAFFDAASPATVWGRRQSTCGGLTWGFYGGVFWSGAPVAVANGTITLPATQTVYLEADPQTGAVSQNVVGWTPGLIRLYQVVTGTTTVTSYTDWRCNAPVMNLASVSVAGGSDVTLDAVAANSQIIELTGALTGNVSVIFPDRPFEFSIANLTSGAFTLTCKVSGGTGVVIGSGKRAKVYCNGSDIVRLTADV